MRVFITGGTGFIGKAVVSRLLEAGHTALVSTRSADKARSMFDDRVEVVAQGNPDALRQTLNNVDAIINLAGEPVLPARWTDAKKKRLVDSRVGLTQGLVDALKDLDRRPERFISASAVGYYGQSAGAEPKPETALAAEDFLARLCVDWEAAARGAEALGLRVVCVRIGLVLGPGGGALDQLLLPFKMCVGGRIGSGEQYMPWIHVDDLVSMFTAAVEDPHFPSVVNGAAPHPVTNAEFTKTLGRVLGRPTLLPVPSFALRAALGEAAGALLGGQNAVPEAALAHGFDFAFSDLEACLRSILGRPRQ